MIAWQGSDIEAADVLELSASDTRLASCIAKPILPLINVREHAAVVDEPSQVPGHRSGKLGQGVAGALYCTAACRAGHAYARRQSTVVVATSRAAATRGQPVELYAFTDEPHILIQPQHQTAFFTRTLDRFRFCFPEKWARFPESCAICPLAGVQRSAVRSRPIALGIWQPPRHCLQAGYSPDESESNLFNARAVNLAESAHPYS
jgi:hypothetical protein